MSSKTTGIQPKTYVGKKELWMFSIGAMGQGMIYAMMSSYISDYYVSTLQLPLIFLTAPAMFFMYYFCLYLNGYVLLLDTAAEG